MIGRACLERKTGVILSFWILFLVFGLRPLAGAADGPVIRVDRTIHTFKPVFEGENLSHTFTIFNPGTAELTIKKVTPS